MTTNTPWVVFGASLVVKVVIVSVSSDLRQGLLLAAPTVVLELFPVLVSNREDKWTSSVTTFEEFGRRGNSLIPLGALLMLAAMCLGFFVAVATTNLLQSDQAITGDQLTDRLAGQLLSFDVPTLPALSLGDLLLLMFVGPIAFVIGKWMGRTLAPSVPVAQGTGNVIAAHICGMVIPMFLVLVFAMMNNEVFDRTQFLVSAFVLALLLCSALYGYRRGRRLVLGTYIAYLLDRASPDAQREILARAHEEATAYQAGAGRQHRITTLFSG